MGEIFTSRNKEANNLQLQNLETIKCRQVSPAMCASHGIMQRNAVQSNHEASTISKTLWAYVPCPYDTSGGPGTQSSTLFSTFCCCFTDDDNCHSQTDVSVHFTTGADPPVTLSQALLCLDNPQGYYNTTDTISVFNRLRCFQLPSDIVSYPISEEIILAEHRSHNVLQQPQVIRSTQMLFIGYDVKSIQEFDIHQRLSSHEAEPTNRDSSESD